MIEVKAKKKIGEFLLAAELHDGGFICLTGENGSGKSSLLNVVSGVLSPDEGFIKINTRDVTRLPMEKRQVVLVTPDSYIPHLSVGKHLVWGAKVKGVGVDEKFLAEVKEKLGVSSFYEKKLASLSLGMKERVALATALISRPEAILIDEASSNIDHSAQFMESYRELASGIDVVFTTQRLEDSKLAEHHYRMKDGVSEREF